MEQTGWKYVLRQFLFVLLLMVLALFFLAVGLMIGYSVIGNGEHSTSILSVDKWQTFFEKFTG